MQTVEEFRNTFLRICKDNHVDPQEVILSQLKSAQKQGSQGAGHCLNLSTHSLGVKSCLVLAKVLATDRLFTELRFNDCMLAEEAVKGLVHGLSSNVACKKVDLKGNNVRGTATEAMGRMLKQNKTIRSVCLEWNAMGMVESAFSVFCEGLGSNHSLQVLDLRSNQISHDGATELATALKRNTTLRWLDLRWNNIGLIGGRALLNSLQYNKTLTKLELAGNNVPSDVLNAIDTAIQHNTDRVGVQNDYQVRMQTLSKELQSVKSDRKQQMTELLGHLDRQESAMRKSTRTANNKMKSLQDALDDRKSQFSDLASKLSMTESELQLSESKVSDLSQLLARGKQEREDILSQHHRDLQRERDERSDTESRMVRELLEANNKISELQGQVDDLERQIGLQKEQIYDLKEQLTHSQADLKLKTTQFDEMKQVEKQRCREMIRSAEDDKQREVQRVRQEAVELERSLKDRIERLENQRIQLEEEISQHKTAALASKVQMDEQIAVAKQKIRREEELRLRQLEEKHHMLQMSKDDLEQHASHQSSSIMDLQSRNANLVLENETLKRKIEELSQEISGKNNEILAEVGKVKIDLTQKIQRLEAEKMSQKELYDKVEELQKKHSESRDEHTVALSAKDKELTELKAKLQMRDAQIAHMRDEDSQRANMLQSAIHNYISRTPFKED